MQNLESLINYVNAIKCNLGLYEIDNHLIRAIVQNTFMVIIIIAVIVIATIIYILLSIGVIKFIEILIYREKINSVGIEDFEDRFRNTVFSTGKSKIINLSKFKMKRNPLKTVIKFAFILEFTAIISGVIQVLIDKIYGFEDGMIIYAQSIIVRNLIGSIINIVVILLCAIVAWKIYKRHNITSAYLVKNRLGRDKNDK